MPQRCIHFTIDNKLAEACSLHRESLACSWEQCKAYSQNRLIWQPLTGHFFHYYSLDTQSMTSLVPFSKKTLAGPGDAAGAHPPRVPNLPFWHTYKFLQNIATSGIGASYEVGATLTGNPGSATDRLWTTYWFEGVNRGPRWNFSVVWDCLPWVLTPTPSSTVSCGWSKRLPGGRSPS